MCKEMFGKAPEAGIVQNIHSPNEELVMSASVGKALRRQLRQYLHVMHHNQTAKP